MTAAGLAGGIAAEAIAADQAGNVVISGADNCVPPRSGASGAGSGSLRGLGTFYGQQMTAGDVYTIAGNGIDRNSGDGGLAAKAGLADPEGLAIDGAGNIAVIVDPYTTEGRALVRVKIAARSGTFYGRKMTAGHIYTIAGRRPHRPRGRRPGHPGEPQPTGSGSPSGPACNLLIDDSGHGRIRSVTRA